MQPEPMPVLRWRPWPLTRAFYLLAPVFFVFLIVISVPTIVHGCSDSTCAADGGRGAAIPAVVILVFVSGFCLSSAFFEARIEARVLVSRGPWWRTQSVRLVDIERVTPGYWGMQVTRRGHGHQTGKALTVWAVQTGNMNRTLGRGGRAGRVADEIMREVERARSDGEQ